MMVVVTTFFAPSLLQFVLTKPQIEATGDTLMLNVENSATIASSTTQPLIDAIASTSKEAQNPEQQETL